jgi:AraC-like DNA-binding protein
MWMSMLESPSKGKVKLEYQKDPAMIDFGFVLSGRINHRILNDRNSMGASGGFAGIGYFPGRKGIAEISDKNRLRILHLHMVPELLYGMVHEDLEDIPNDFRDIIEGNTGRTFMSKRSMGPITRMTVSEIFNPASSGSPKKLFLEYKAMELLNMQITHLMNHENGSGISASERSRIIEARDMLLQNLADPPSLNNLSRHFSLSRNKLQQGFRVMFGNSVFGYLREHKMQKACHLFKTTDMNVSQVAWETGYINVSKFTRAFKKRFGALPNQYRQSILL